MTKKENKKYTFMDLLLEVLEEENMPLSINEIGIVQLEPKKPKN